MNLLFRFWFNLVLLALAFVLISGAMTGTIYSAAKGGHRIRKPLLPVSSVAARVAALLAGLASLTWLIVRLAK